MIRTSRRVICYGFAAMMLSCFTASVCCADGPSDNTKSDASSVPPKVIKPEEAKDHAGEVVTVEFTVIAANELDSGRCFLNSSTDRNDPESFTAYITPKGLAEFKKDTTTSKPADYYKSKKIRVTGKIETYHDKFEIKVDDPTQIKIVEEKVDENTGKKP
jgi:DNA/RNA endonuclease YhcR with UshA esterase domain